MIKRLIKYISHKIYTIGRFEEMRINNLREKALLNKIATIDDEVWISESAHIENHNGDKAKLKFGRGTRIMGNLCVFPYGGKIEMGNYCLVGPETRIWSGENITIGNNVLISHHVNILDFAHERNHVDRAQGFKNFAKNGHPLEKGKIPTAGITIEDDVAIYAGAHIIMGVTIGKGSVISAGCVVMKDVPPFSLVAGNPGKVVWKIKTD
jgi:acetyltransferase-like isoleucine patch superfamily enzyme